MNTDPIPLTPAPSDPPQRLPMWKRALEHSVKISICGYSIFRSLIALVRVGTDTPLAPALAELPLYLVLMLCVTNILGGVYALIGMFGNARNLRKRLNAEQLGWLLLAFGWVGYVLASFTYSPPGIVAASIAPWIAVGSLGRFIWLTKVERALEATQNGNGDVHEP